MTDDEYCAEVVAELHDRIAALKQSEADARAQIAVLLLGKAKAEAERDALKLRVNSLIGLCKSYSGALLDSDYPPAERDKLDALVGDIEKPPSAKGNATLTNHAYVSTACQHDLHTRCRLTCKFCDTRCLCPCHAIDAALRAKEE